MKPIYLILALLCTTATCFAQQHKFNALALEYETSFDSCAKYTSQVYDVSISMPNGFHDCKFGGIYLPKSKHDTGYHPASMFASSLMSDDGQCMVLIADLATQARFHEVFIPTELKDCGGDFMSDVYYAVRGAWTHEYFFDNPLLIDISRYSKQIAPEPFNATVANHVWLPANDTIKGTHYTARDFLFFGKPGRIVYRVTILLTAEAAKNRQKYLDPIFAAFKFGNNNSWKYDKDLDKNAAKKLLPRGPWDSDNQNKSDICAR